MANREEALRRIFEAMGVDARLTQDQKRELLAHLDDAVRAKVAAGTPEIDAMGMAFSELGSLKEIAGQFPASTPDGRLLAVWSRGAALKGFALLAIFAFIQIFLIPKFAYMFMDLGLPIPRLMEFFVEAAGPTVELFPWAAAILLGLAVAPVVARRKGWTEATRKSLRVASLALYGTVALFCVGLVVGCAPPIAALFNTLIQ